MSTPSLHFHYRNFITTTSWSAPVFCIGTLILAVLPLGFLPFHQYDRFPRSIRKPKISSCHLYAGHHLSNNQITLKLIMEQLRGSIFDVTVHAFDTSSVVRLRSSPDFTPDRIIVLPFTVTLTTLTFNQRSSRRFGNYFWKSSPEGQTSIFLTVTKKTFFLSWHTVACYALILFMLL